LVVFTFADSCRLVSAEIDEEALAAHFNEPRRTLPDIPMIVVIA
jgi:hypothetical protein